MHRDLARRTAALALALVPFASPAFAAAADTVRAAADPGPGVSPALVAAADEVWRVIARPDNPVWPGWNAAGTPLLFYLPGHQDLLVNHPHPPAGFRPFTGAVRIAGADMRVRDGATLIDYDGQNTALDVAGVRTLVVADPLSSLRQNVAQMISDPRPAAEKVRDLSFEQLATDPYDEMAMVAHEAFHVYQDSIAPERSDEMLLLHYPVLSVDNNVGFGLEAAALQAAFEAPDEAAFRAAALRWLAVRLERRRALPARSVAYEDGTELNEGLAKYVEYRLFQVLEGRAAGPSLLAFQGFHGFADLSPQRRALVRQMRRNLRGEVNVNNDPYGTAPLRFRLYYSGMAIGVLLDRLAPGWQREALSPGRSLTDRVRDALRPDDASLAAAAAAAHADTADAGLRAAKTRLAAEGRAHVQAKLAALETGPGTRLVVDYSACGTPGLAMAFTPFGITDVDSVRTFFEQVPIRITFPDGSTLNESSALPVLRDSRRREVSCRMPRTLTRADVERLAGGPLVRGSAPRAVALALPDVALDLRRARLAWDAGTLRVTLVPDPAAPAH